MHNDTDDKALPASKDSMAGMTKQAQGDASASDVARGYFKLDNAEANRPPYPPPDADPITGELTERGFAGRPQGWER